MPEEISMFEAEKRIKELRSSEVTLQFQDHEGQALKQIEVDVQLTKHDFLFGSNGFKIRSIDDKPELQAAYEERFAALLNYATLPFYWGSYERQQGQVRQAQLKEMARWCQQHHITTKGHPLLWHEVFPRWAAEHDDAQVREWLEARARGLPDEFAGLVDIWDVVNEATVSARFDNAMGRWIKEKGAADVVEHALRLAHAGNPAATLLYNDFNISPEFEQLVEELLARDARVDVIGIQSHMHQGHWPLERAWEVCETYARFGLPLHFTELTVLSGRLKDKEDKDWHTRHTDWDTTPEGEAAQAVYVSQLYTLLFSHPAVEAITWWDFADYQAWQGAPAGLLREDMSPKPVYERLMELIQGEWRTDEQVTTDVAGQARCRCYFGEHIATAQLPAGAQLRGNFILSAGDPHDISVTLR